MEILTHGLPTIPQRAAYLLMSEPHERDAEILRQSLCSARVEGNTLIEIICTRTLTDLNLIKQAYRARYNSELEQEITSRTGNSTSFKEALVAILSSIRYDGVRANTSMAMCDAKMIFEAMECGKSIDRKTILSLISSKSREQLRAIFASFKQLYGHELSKSLKRERFGEFGKEVQRIIRCVQFPDKYLSKQLRMALKNGDAKEVLIRIVIARVGIDIKNINSAFAAKTGWSLESLIRTEFCNGIEIDAITADLLIRLLQFS
ncbi:hypothetical protein QJS10_CPB19g01451 [Acorus calamus]|uniref:Annexin n=1 Tax=Acorus calamus TaxID=4465 RepID=A0AAV9CE77_ACOCL|nr:hypothetical protein QJS10_CPB19g01451 [Acorus calamus]